VVETFSEIEDSICVGQRRQNDTDERVILFSKMNSGHKFDAGLVQRLKAAIRQRYSTRHVPKFIFEVTDIPYTVNGKKCEINVKQIVSGHSATVSGTVANPESLIQYKQYFDLPIEGDDQARLSSRL
jgi:acetoacetyl-CoA synthetase